MKLAIFGATGHTGQHLVEQALAQGHQVAALARTPAKVAVKHSNLMVIQGDILDSACIDSVIAGADAVISALGPSSNRPEFIVSQGMQHIIAAMKKQGIRRLIISAGAGVADPNDAPTLLNHTISFLLKLTAKNVYADMQRTVDVVRGSDLEWTVIRVPRLTDGPKTGSIHVGYVGKGTGTQLSRANLADYLLRQLTDSTYVHKAPAISD
jgi:putative NADH-flavin reductase